MTANNTMGNLETWVRQLNGELNVEEYSKPSEASKADIIKEYHAFLNADGCCKLTLTNSKSKNIRIRPHFRLIFDKETFKIKSIEMLEHEKEINYVSSRFVYGL
jgi:hypothetical protein